MWSSDKSMSSGCCISSALVKGPNSKQHERSEEQSFWNLCCAETQGYLLNVVNEGVEKASSLTARGARLIIHSSPVQSVGFLCLHFRRNRQEEAQLRSMHLLPEAGDPAQQAYSCKYGWTLACSMVGCHNCIVFCYTDRDTVRIPPLSFCCPEHLWNLEIE